MLWDIEEEEVHEGHLKGKSWLGNLCFGTPLVKLFFFCAILLVEKDLVIGLKGLIRVWQASREDELVVVG